MEQKEFREILNSITKPIDIFSYFFKNKNIISEVDIKTYRDKISQPNFSYYLTDIKNKINVYGDKIEFSDYYIDFDYFIDNTKCKYGNVGLLFSQVIPIEINNIVEHLNIIYSINPESVLHKTSNCFFDIKSRSIIISISYNKSKKINSNLKIEIGHELDHFYECVLDTGKKSTYGNVMMYKNSSDNILSKFLYYSLYLIDELEKSARKRQIVLEAEDLKESKDSNSFHKFNPFSKYNNMSSLFTSTYTYRNIVNILKLYKTYISELLSNNSMSELIILLNSENINGANNELLKIFNINFKEIDNIQDLHKNLKSMYDKVLFDTSNEINELYKLFINKIKK